MQKKSISSACLVLLFSGGILSGCTTVEFVRKDITPKKQAVVRYLPTSNANKEAKYREEVKKQANGFCGGEFDITKEYQARQDTGTSTGVGTGLGFGMGGLMVGSTSANTAMYNFVEFSCR